MKDINFIGRLPASKSLFNRILIVKSFFPNLTIEGSSDCEDVVKMQEAIARLTRHEPLECGHAGTVLRFLSLRLSRESGTHILNGSERLFARPQEELIAVLRQLGSQTEFRQGQLTIKSEGWKLFGDSLHVSSQRSSQFLSGVVLSAWQFDKPIHISPGREIISPEYWLMTLSLVKSLGMNVEKSELDYIVFPSHHLATTTYKVEQDLSSAFAIAALAAMRGQVILQDFPMNSLQPDSIFPRVLSEMGVSVERQEGILKIKASNLKAMEFDINLAPDMFPILAVLAAQADGTSRFFHGKQLRFKESDRWHCILNLLENMQKKFVINNNILEIKGSPTVHREKFIYNCLQDHRLAMAVGLARYIGYDVEVQNPQVVNKSFPEYWDILGTAL